MSVSDNIPFRTVAEQNIEAPATHLVLDKEFIMKLPAGYEKPSVKNLTKFRANGGTDIIQNFTDGQEGQRISIIGDGTTTVQANANIKRPFGTGVLRNGEVYNFTYDGGVWKEDTNSIMITGSPARPQVEFIAGPGVTITIVDDPGNDKVVVTISSP